MHLATAHEAVKALRGYPSNLNPLKGNIMKRILIAAALFAFITAAQAAPTSVTNSTGTNVFGLNNVLGVLKDTSAGFNRVKVSYAGNEQYITDDAAWSKFAAVVASFRNPVSVSPSQAYDVSKLSVVFCSSGKSVVWGAHMGYADEFNDGCAFFNAAKAASN